MATIQATQILSISTAFLASGGIATFSLFDIPIIKSQPASRSLPMVRWLFSRGSHVFPTAAAIASSGFAYLTYNSLPPTTFSSLLSTLLRTKKPGLYALASLLTISIAPWTSLAMIPTNFALIKKNEDLGGTRSQKSAEYREHKKTAEEREMIGAFPRSAEDSVNGKDDVGQWFDFSPPQERTVRDSTKKDDEEVRGLLENFAKLNWARAGLMGVGGVVGLVGALA